MFEGSVVFTVDLVSVDVFDPCYFYISLNTIIFKVHLFISLGHQDFNGSIHIHSNKSY